MAKETKEKKSKSSKSKKTTPEFVGKIAHMGLGEFGKMAMGIYAEEVNLDRAVPDLFDGLKPVQRRILWGAYSTRGSFVKTARIVGDVIGKYHPHGDASVSAAMTTMVHHNTPALLGTGNWGGLLDPAAAMRYTNCRLSHYGETYFDSNYFNKDVVTFIPNYDDTEVEPLVLPAQLPTVLLNGAEGIGVGTTTNIPTFTPESVIKVLTSLLKGEDLSPKDFAKALDYHHKWGGNLINTKENRTAWLGLFTGAKASVKFEATLHIDRDNKALTIDDWPPGLNVISFVNKIRGLKETDRIFNHKGDTGFRIEMRKDHNFTQFDKYVERVKKLAQSRKTFVINVTQRKAKRDEEGELRINTHFLSVSIPVLLKKWLMERLQYEKRSLQHRLNKQQEQIELSKLLIYASTKLDVIFKALRDSDSKAYLVKHLKITGEQADTILDLKVRRLSKLDQEDLKKQLKAQEAFKAQLEQWFKKPKLKLIQDMDAAMAAILKDRKYELSKDKAIAVA